ncbi:MAG: ABC transporter ATP-binding protein [Deltaproteobacteria bacterium]
MPAFAIRAEHLSKRYRIGGRKEPYKTLRDAVADGFKTIFRPAKSTGRAAADSRPDTIWALRDISFEIPRGEVVGVVGRNGAGKSTLLKILSRITEPTEGFAEIRGRIGSLLEVGTGFHPELTGRENIYLNGAILGMRRSEIDRKFDEIVAFAEVERFIDTPVKHYSSGMYLRLAFAVAAHLEPEILLVDEVLAVGDAAFRKKCLGKMGQVAGEGRTVMLVSHDMAAVEGICRSAFLLDEGRIVKAGSAREVVEAYLSSVPASAGQPLDLRRDRQGDGRLRFTGVTLRSAEAVAEAARCGQDLEIAVRYRSDGSPLRNVAAAVVVYTMGGQCMMVLSSQMVGAEFDGIPSEGDFICRLRRFSLAPGQYTLNLYCEINGVLADWVQQAVCLTVEGGDFFGTGRLPPSSHGGFLVDQEWRVESGGGGAGKVDPR